MNFNEVKNMIDDLNSLTQKWNFSPRFQISGGEPLMRKDLMKILDYTFSLDMETNILTNGTLISKEKAKELYQRGIKRLQVSIDGKKETHNKIRGRDYSYERSLKGVLNCNNAGILVNVSMTLMQSNKMDLEDVVVNALSAGAGIVGFQSYVPNKNLGIKDKEFINAKETYNLFQDIRGLRKKYKGKIKVLETEVLWQIMQWDTKLKQEARKTGKFLSGCGAGFSGVSVLADGTIYPCRRLPIPLGNIKDIRLKDLMLNNETLKNLRDFNKLKENCCEDVYYCKGCRAIAYATTGDYMAKDPMCFKQFVKKEEIEPRIIRRW
jgi:radical SAM protein with 4Fe4S-binding SPASM domain